MLKCIYAIKQPPRARAERRHLEAATNALDLTSRVVSPAISCLQPRANRCEIMATFETTCCADKLAEVRCLLL